MNLRGCVSARLRDVKDVYRRISRHSLLEPLHKVVSYRYNSHLTLKPVILDIGITVRLVVRSELTEHSLTCVQAATGS